MPEGPSVSVAVASASSSPSVMFGGLAVVSVPLSIALFFPSAFEVPALAVGRTCEVLVSLIELAALAAGWASSVQSKERYAGIYLGGTHRQPLPDLILLKTIGGGMLVP